MKRESLKDLIYGIVFGSLFAYVVAFGLGVAITRLNPEWAGKLVCPTGRVELISFKQAYFCVVSTNDFVNIQDAMFWAVFWRVLIFSVPGCLLLTFGFMKFATIMYKRREAAGF